MGSAMKNLIRRGKRVVRVGLGTDFFFEPQITKTTVRHGSEYGGWELAEDGLNARSTVYSFGIGEDISFDLSLIAKFGVRVHGFDPTPRSIQWVRAQRLGSQFVMHEYGLAGFDGEIAFSPPKNPAHISHTILAKKDASSAAFAVPVRRLSSIMEELGDQHIDLLKMDIEGAEYQVIDDVVQSGIRPRQWLIEFHHRFPGVGVAATKRAISQLNSAGYRVYWVSGSGEEFSFVSER